MLLAVDDCKTPVAFTRKPLRDNPIFSTTPYMLDRNRITADQPLLVLFETARCKDYQQLHDEVLSQKDVRVILDRFDVVRLNATDNKTPIIAPDGSRITPKIWFEKAALTQVPALLFFNKNGDEVLRTDSLVLNQRMVNALNYVLDKAYEKD